MRQIKKLIKRGLYDPDKENPFDLFISSTDIRYTYYKDTRKILGSTYGMCVLQVGVRWPHARRARTSKFCSVFSVSWCGWQRLSSIPPALVCSKQDFEALTPNLLCRTIETVEGGGLVVLLLRLLGDGAPAAAPLLLLCWPWCVGGSYCASGAGAGAGGAAAPPPD